MSECESERNEFKDKLNLDKYDKPTVTGHNCL